MGTCLSLSCLEVKHNAPNNTLSASTNYRNIPAAASATTSASVIREAEPVINGTNGTNGTNSTNSVGRIHRINRTSRRYSKSKDSDNLKIKAHPPKSRIEPVFFPKGKSTIEKENMQKITKVTVNRNSNEFNDGMKNGVKNDVKDNEKTSKDINKDSNHMDSRCEICFHSFITSDQVYELPCECTKMYHKNCIETWFVKKPTCPFCSYNINVDKYQFQIPPEIDDEYEVWPEEQITLPTLTYVPMLISVGAVV